MTLQTRHSDQMTQRSPQTPPRIGILMLDTRFPRIKGDIGNPESFDFPVRYKIVKGASADHAVRRGATGLLPAFIAGAQELIAQGATAISTSCGFLALFQHEMTEALPVPVLTSSLLQVARVNAGLPSGTRAGVLTIAADSLTPAHFAAANVPDGTPIGGVDPDGAFATAILNDAVRMDFAQARTELIAAAQALQAAHPHMGAIVLECTNMGPYADDIRAATGLPVYSIIDLLTDFFAAHHADDITGAFDRPV